MNVGRAEILVSFALGAGVGWLGCWKSSSSRPSAEAVSSASAANAPAAAAGAHGEGVDGVAFEYEYVAPKDPGLQPFYARARDGDLLRRIPEIETLDGVFLLPRPLRFVTAECREVNAFYAAERGEVVMCYETMKALYERGQLLEQDNGDLGDDYAKRYLLANLRFILMHETGHALIDLLQLPITGREEDAVDQLATAHIQHFSGAEESSAQVTDNLRMAANWFLARSSGQYDLDTYADEHSLGEQRYFNLQCLLYGANPERYVGIVTSGDLPEARARGCATEARRANKAWLRLLLPHIAPEFAMTEEKADKLFEQKDRERDRAATAPYVR